MRALVSGEALHDIERPLLDDGVHDLVPGLVQPEPSHAGGQQAQHGHTRAAELKQSKVVDGKC